MLRVGLIGVGGISSAHIPAWDSMPDKEQLDIVDICLISIIRSFFRKFLPAYR